ncbi:G-type lectin S-receptor-like serine/threonine-protein kinase [Forsythia ovata]|uniref:G-type lectin S-receptor-like serine/threonine-protein kinase n=1 Tax=Forsythia ovata TaxID=205694 RepID=A0ABD1S7H8_9LAMI
MMSVSRMRGTPGYMAPKWTRPDPITSKVDVYNFGLVLMEIVSGSWNFVQLDPNVESHQWFFPRWAFDKVFKEMNVEDILDHMIKHCYDSREHFGQRGPSFGFLVEPNLESLHHPWGFVGICKSQDVSQ